MKFLNVQNRPQPTMTEAFHNKHIAVFCLDHQEMVNVQLDFVSLLKTKAKDLLKFTNEINQRIAYQQLISKLDLLQKDGERFKRQLVQSGKRFALLSTNDPVIRNRWINDFNTLKIELELFEVMCRNAKAMAWKLIRGKRIPPKSQLNVVSRMNVRMSA